MIASIARLLEQRFNLEYDQVMIYLNRLVVTLAALVFIILATFIVVFDEFMPGQHRLETVQIGDIAADDIYAPRSIIYASDVLTQQRQEEARSAITPSYDLPSPVVARQQASLAQQILSFIENIRHDPYADPDQKASDLNQITALDLEPQTIQQILEIDVETWQDLEDQIMVVLESVFQDEIRDTDLDRIRSLLPTQVSVRFNELEASVIVAIVTDLVRSNTNLNQEATDEAREAAAAAVAEQTVSFERGQIVAAGGEPITAVQFEALEELGFLRPAENRLQRIVQAFLGSVIVMVVTGLYVARFRPSLYDEPQLLALLSAIFLIVLFGARLGLIGEFYIYPTAALALLFSAIVGAQIAVIGVLGLAFLVGIMAQGSLEMASLVTIGGMIGALTMRRSERMNSFFIAGLMVGVGNVAVVSIFSLVEPASINNSDLILRVTYVLLNGILTAAAALAGLYIITLIFNLPTALKLVELSQPSQPLLQRLLREAPGSYQHSLQVANLSEQAAEAIGANATLTHVAALYHDIGKMLNPAFFTENQRYTGNPHDSLNDPYRSADIIVGHVTGGDDMARQYRLPNRLRDFIREHHGTSKVFVFYQQAVILAGEDEALVDPDEFAYPGPRPRSRETAILMLADSCEAAVRSRQPGSRKEIEETVRMVFDGKRQDAQLDDSGLTLHDLKTIETIFIDMLQAVFHPRIDYTEAIVKVRHASEKVEKPAPETKVEKDRPGTREVEVVLPQLDTEKPKPVPVKTQTLEMPPVTEDDENTPMPEVPRLRRVSESKQDENGTKTEEQKSDQVVE